MCDSKTLHCYKGSRGKKLILRASLIFISDIDMLHHEVAEVNRR